MDHILHLNFTDCFGGEGLALYSDNGLKILSKPPIWYLTLGRVLHLQTYITNAFSEEKPRHLLIYHYISADNLLDIYI